MKRFLALATMVVMALGWGINASASVIFSNLGGGTNIFLPNQGYSSSMESFGFLVDGDYVVNEITVALGNLRPKQVTGGAINFSVMTGSGWNTIWSESISLPASPLGRFYSSLLTIDAAGDNLFLSAGQYRLEIATGSDNQILWCENSIGVLGSHFYSSAWTGGVEIGGVDRMAAFQITGTTPVPEPASLLLLGSGLIGLLGLKKRREEC